MKATDNITRALQLLILDERLEVKLNGKSGVITFKNGFSSVKILSAEYKFYGLPRLKEFLSKFNELNLLDSSDSEYEVAEPIKEEGKYGIALQDARIQIDPESIEYGSSLLIIFRRSAGKLEIVKAIQIEVKDQDIHELANDLDEQLNAEVCDRSDLGGSFCYAIINKN